MANVHDHRPGDPHSLHPPGIEEAPAPGAVPLIELSDLTTRYGAVPVLQNVSLRIWPRQFMAIVGPNGGGKTTLLRAMLGMLPLASGTIRLRGATIRGGALERVGYVPQLEAIDWNFPITVEEVIAMGLFTNGRRRWFGGIGEKEKRKLHEIMERLNISGLGRRHIRELSGGQQQAVFLGRALLGEPEIILLDEPASGLDIHSRDDMIHFLHEINHQGVAVVLTAHDLNWVAAHLPWVVCLNRRLIAEGKPHQVFTPEVLKQTYSGELVVLHQEGMVMIGERPHAPHN